MARPRKSSGPLRSGPRPVPSRRPGAGECPTFRTCSRFSSLARSWRVSPTAGARPPVRHGARAAKPGTLRCHLQGVRMRGWPLTTRGRASSTDVGVNVPLETVPSSSSVRDARAGPPLRGERHVTGLANQHAPSLCPAHSPAACWGLARAPARQRRGG